MGLLKQCNLLSWEETKFSNEIVLRNGISQFLRVYKQYSDLRKDALLWGEEIEYLLVKMDKKKRVVRAAVRASCLLERLNDHQEHKVFGYWMPEQVEFQIESIPSEPYSGRLEDLILVENNMRQRRGCLKDIMANGEHALTLTAFPRCGCPGFTYPYLKTNCESGLKSNFLPEGTITNANPRYRTLEANFMERAGKEFAINMPVFQDTNTKSPWIDGVSWQKGKPDHVYLDVHSLGHACNSMHVTFQAVDLEDAKNIHDQFIVIAPIMMALTAGSPVTRGYLTDIDSRWAYMEQASDDRSDQEKQPQLWADGNHRYQFSRSMFPPWFISKEGMQYNDGQSVYNQGVYDELVSKGVDEQMAMHVAILMTRDVLLGYDDCTEQRAEDSTEDFDNVNTSVWPTVRLKLPSTDGSIGWRVEFRPMGVQLTDFENASFAIFIVLMTRIIRDFGVDFLIPISKTRVNFYKAVVLDAVRTARFHFRCHTDQTGNDAAECEGMTVDEIINGQVGTFTGIIPIIHQYLDKHVREPAIRQKLNKHLDVVSRTASGERPTQARWIREFVLSHPVYKQDSVVAERIQYDLISECLENNLNLE